MTTFVVVHNEIQYNGIDHKKIVNINERNENVSYNIQSCCDQQINVNLDKSREVSINSMCILLGIPIPVFDNSTPESLREDMFSFIKSLSICLSKTNFSSLCITENSQDLDSDNEIFKMEENTKNNITNLDHNSNLDSNSNFRPNSDHNFSFQPNLDSNSNFRPNYNFQPNSSFRPNYNSRPNLVEINQSKFCHLTKEVMENFINYQENDSNNNNQDLTEKDRLTNSINRPKNNNIKYKISNVSNFNNQKSELKNNVYNIVNSISRSELEGRSVISVANQILNSNKKFGKMRLDAHAASQIENCIKILGEENKIILTKDLLKFGLVKPEFDSEILNTKNNPEILNDKTLDEIWSIHQSSLLKVTSFKSAVNILINSCYQLKNNTSKEKEIIASYICIKFIDKAYLR